MQSFITDFGKSYDLGIMNDGEKMVIHRYAAWEHCPIKGKPQVKETSADLTYLKAKYQTNEVVKVKGA